MVDYIKHLTPVTGDWQGNLAGDLVKISKDPDVPVKLRDTLKGGLSAMKEELERLSITYERSEW